MGNLVKTSMHRVDEQDGVDEWEITLYEYDGRCLVTKEVNALGNVTTYEYDGNGNLKKKTDADGYVTVYTYNALDMVTNINYNGGKEVNYQYNKVGDLVEMTDWTGTTSFEVDLLDRITRTTDHKGNVVEYTYDACGNQTSVTYPDETVVTNTYDLLGQLKTVTETDGRTTTYTYDGMGRTVKMEYPHGWVEEYTYDCIGQLLNVNDIDPENKDMKTQRHIYEYDDCGNMTYEYMRGNGTGEATVENFYTYDALHRITSTKENYGNAWREYTYDSLGNLTYESNSNSVTYDYILNNLNQITTKYYSDGRERTIFTYDARGNLVLEEYAKNNGNGKRTTVGEYTYDETNSMVYGVNANGESSAYLYNGLGALVENTWVIAKNGYGYHDVDASEPDGQSDDAEGETDDDDDIFANAGLTRTENGFTVIAYNKGNNGNGNGQGNGNGSGNKPTGTTVKKTSTVVKQFVVDYTSATFEPLMEHEVNGLDYRYVYGNDRLSVNITGVETSSGNIIENGNQIRLYYHMDYLGSADYLTSPVSLKVTSWTYYNEWGKIVHNAVLKCGQRELDLVKRFATHDYDAVLDLYYAKARMYDADNRRFAEMDPVKGYITDPLSLVQYLYAIDNGLRYVDLNGREAIDAGGGGGHNYGPRLNTGAQLTQNINPQSAAQPPKVSNTTPSQVSTPSSKVPTSVSPNTQNGTLAQTSKNNQMRRTTDTMRSTSDGVNSARPRETYMNTISCRNSKELPENVWAVDGEMDTVGNFGYAIYGELHGLWGGGKSYQTDIEGRSWEEYIFPSIGVESGLVKIGGDYENLDWSLSIVSGSVDVGFASPAFVSSSVQVQLIQGALSFDIPVEILGFEPYVGVELNFLGIGKSAGLFSGENGHASDGVAVKTGTTPGFGGNIIFGIKRVD